MWMYNDWILLNHEAFFHMSWEPVLAIDILWYVLIVYWTLKGYWILLNYLTLFGPYWIILLLEHDWTIWDLSLGCNNGLCIWDLPLGRNNGFV